MSATPPVPDPAAAPGPASATAARRRPLYPGWPVRLIVGLSLVVVMLSRALPAMQDPPFPWNDRATANVLGVGFMLAAFISLWVWFTFYSGYAPVARRIVFFGAIAAIVAFFGMFRLKDFSGALVARFEPRWTTVADRRLGKIEAAANASQIDFAAADPIAFPQFLGPERSGWIPDPGLARDWTDQPPKLLWRQPIGAGWSAFAATNGFAVTMEQRGDQEWVACYRIDDGQPIWGHAIDARHEHPLGGIGPRATPTIAGGRIYTVGATGVVQCFQPDGKRLWHVDLFQHYGLTQYAAEVEVMWGRAGSPLVVDGLVIVPAGGVTNAAAGKTPKSLIALNADSGEIVWEAGDDQISYASPALATLAGTRQIVIVNEKTVSGHEVSSGHRLWQHKWPGDSSSAAISSQAVPVGNDRLLLSKGYSGGAEMIQIGKAKKSAQTVETVWRNSRVLQTKFTNVVVLDGFIYGLSDGILECVEVETGDRQWKQGRYGHGQILGVGNLLLVQAEDGGLALVDANPDEFLELSNMQAIEGTTWNNLCLYGKKLLVRNSEEAACYELP